MNQPSAHCESNPFLGGRNLQGDFLFLARRFSHKNVHTLRIRKGCLPGCQVATCFFFGPQGCHELGGSFVETHRRGRWILRVHPLQAVDPNLTSTGAPPSPSPPKRMYILPGKFGRMEPENDKLSKRNCLLQKLTVFSASI